MTTAAPAERLLTLEEVADEMRVSLSAVRAWVRTGRLRAFRPAQRVLVRRSDLDAFIAAGERHVTRAKSLAPKETPADAGTSTGGEGIERGSDDAQR